jgi:hypothetical protein
VTILTSIDIRTFNIIGDGDFTRYKIYTGASFSGADIGFGMFILELFGKRDALWVKFNQSVFGNPFIPSEYLKYRE